MHGRGEAWPAERVHRRQVPRGLDAVRLRQLRGAGPDHLRRIQEKGYFVVPTEPDWEKYRAGLIDFYEDPEAHPLKTPSGKLEFFSQDLAKHFPDDVERPPVPHWIEKGESHDEARLQ